MDYRRFVTFLVVCFAFSYLYSNLVLTPQPPAVADTEVKSSESDGAEVEPTVDAANKSADTVLGDATPEEGADTKSVASVIPEFPEQSVSLGSNDPNGNFALKATLSSKLSLIHI